MSIEKSSSVFCNNQLIYPGSDVGNVEALHCCTKHHLGGMIAIGCVTFHPSECGGGCGGFGNCGFSGRVVDGLSDIVL